LNKSNEVFLISKEEDFDLICSPIRASVLEILVAFGPLPIREIAEKLGRSATLIHHHVGILYRGGLLREHAREKRGKHLERVFAVTTEDWRYDFESRPEVMAKGMLRIAKTWGKHAERLLNKALRKNKRFTLPMRRFLTVRAETGQLSEQAAQSVRDHLSAIRSIFEQERRRGAGDTFHIFWNYFPLSADSPKDRDKVSSRPKSGTKPKGKGAKSRPKGAKTPKKATKPSADK
jgi:DNA-binding transcriptional ArsR family regulator